MRVPKGEFTRGPAAGADFKEPFVRFVAAVSTWQQQHGYENAWWWPGLLLFMTVSASFSNISTPGVVSQWQSGEFEAVPWSDAEKTANPNRRGMIRATPNGHAFEYADGTPFFLVGDTWWATPTFRFRWHDEL